MAAAGRRGSVPLALLLSIEGTCSWSRSTTAASGIATSISLETSCERTCLTSSPTASMSYTARASDWYERNGDRSEAIRHALAAEDFERAADLVELAIPAMRRSRQEATLRGWLEALPDELVRVRPVLSVGYAGVLLLVGELEGVEARLRGRRAVAGHDDRYPVGPEASPAGMVVVDDEEFRRLPGTIELYRAALALARGDVPDTSAARPAGARAFP